MALLPVSIESFLQILFCNSLILVCLFSFQGHGSPLLWAADS